MTWDLICWLFLSQPLWRDLFICTILKAHIYKHMWLFIFTLTSEEKIPKANIHAFTKLYFQHSLCPLLINPHSQKTFMMSMTWEFWFASCQSSQKPSINLHFLPKLCRPWFTHFATNYYELKSSIHVHPFFHCSFMSTNICSASCHMEHSTLPRARYVTLESELPKTQVVQ